MANISINTRLLILTDTQLTDALSTYDPNFLLQCTVAYQPVENLQDIICKLHFEKSRIKAVNIK